MSKPFTVHSLLNRAELDELENFAREPGRTIEKCQTWLEGRGFVVKRSAVHRWKQQFDLGESFDSSNDLAKVVMAAAKSEDTISMSEAAALQLAQMIFESSAQLQLNGTASPSEIRRLSSGLRNVVGSKAVLQDVTERQKRAVEEAEKIAKGGGSGGDVVSKVREILGVPLIPQESIDAVRKAMFG